MRARPVCSRETLEASPRCIHGAVARARVHGGKGKLTSELVDEGGDAVPQRRRRCGPGFCSGKAALRRVMLVQGRGGGCSSCRGRREGKGAGRKKSLPRSPIYRGGMVTAPVTTPPGSPASPGLCDFRVAVPARVYARHRKGPRSFVLPGRGI